jgi:hypothetical protein
MSNDIQEAKDTARDCAHQAATNIVKQNYELAQVQATLAGAYATLAMVEVQQLANRIGGNGS